MTQRSNKPTEFLDDDGIVLEDGTQIWEIWQKPISQIFSVWRSRRTDGSIEFCLYAQGRDAHHEVATYETLEKAEKAYQEAVRQQLLGRFANKEGEKDV